MITANTTDFVAIRALATDGSHRRARAIGRWMAPMPPTGRASSAAPLTPSTELGPPADAIWYSTKSSDSSEGADVYSPAMADSRSHETRAPGHPPKS